MEFSPTVVLQLLLECENRLTLMISTSFCVAKCMILTPDYFKISWTTFVGFCRISPGSLQVISSASDTQKKSHRDSFAPLPISSCDTWWLNISKNICSANSVSSLWESYWLTKIESRNFTDDRWLFFWLLSSLTQANMSLKWSLTQKVSSLDGFCFVFVFCKWLW